MVATAGERFLEVRQVMPISDLVQRIRSAGKEPNFYGPQNAANVDRLE